MAVITVSTVGYGEIHPLSETGQVFTVTLIVLGFGTFAYSIAALTRFVLEGGFFQSFRKLRMEHAISQLSGHVIVCGLGRKGQGCADSFTTTEFPSSSSNVRKQSLPN